MHHSHHAVENLFVAGHDQLVFAEFNHFPVNGKTAAVNILRQKFRVAGLQFTQIIFAGGGGIGVFNAVTPRVTSHTRTVGQSFTRPCGTLSRRTGRSVSIHISNRQPVTTGQTSRVCGKRNDTIFMVNRIHRIWPTGAQSRTGAIPDTNRHATENPAHTNRVRGSGKRQLVSSGFGRTDISQKPGAITHEVDVVMPRNRLSSPGHQLSQYIKHSLLARARSLNLLNSHFLRICTGNITGLHIRQPCTGTVREHATVSDELTE